MIPRQAPAFKPLSAQIVEKYECLLDDTCAVNVPKPKTKAEEEELIRKFLAGLEKLFQRENNWTFLQPLVLTMEHCAKCQTCSDACHIFEASGRNEIYRPTYRSEIMRRLYFKYVKHGGLISLWQHGDIKLNWPLIARLIELSYRCNLCRRCAQTCPIGADNGLVAHELRKLFSQEMGIAAKELHDTGSMLQLKVGSSTGMNPEVVKDNVQFIDEDTSEKTGIKVETPWDVEGADVLLIHNAGEFLAWPENPGAFALILNAAGIKWTLSSEVVAYDSINYGLWYDDAQFARVALKHAQAAKKLKVKKIVLGECGHAHKALSVIADRLLLGDLNIPRESSMTLLHEIVMSGRLKLDPSRNDFPVTLHDPCNLVRLMGVVQPQRESLEQDLPALPRNGAARREQLLLRRGQRLRHHAGEQLPGLALQRRRSQEARADPERVRRLLSAPKRRNTFARRAATARGSFGTCSLTTICGRRKSSFMVGWSSSLSTP